MNQIYVDNQAFEADPKQNLLHACLSHGLNLEYFCWHPALGSVGACRQCAVKQFKDENDQQGKIVMACMTPAVEGTRISIDDPEAVQFRAAVIEGLMLNHPHDCPVCDEGGECHLQDMTVMSGHNYRDSEFPKRTFRNQYLGPLINHEMNRCIQCYRCVRYYREYSGGDDLNSYLLHDTVFFGRHEDGVLQNEFSGNLVEVCPTGVFTDKTLKQHYTRKWDLQMAPSVCVHCGLGCNITAGERYGTLRRVVNRYNHAVNGYFLCDRGRFGYEFVNSERRIRQPQLRRDGGPASVSHKEAVEHLGALLSAGGRVIGIGSPRASLEANFALRTLVGAEHFHAGVADQELRLLTLMRRILEAGPARSASLHEVERSDAVLVLGEDVTNVAPRMALSLRQSVRQQPMRIAQRLNIPLFLDYAVREAVQDEKGPLFLATPHATRLDDVAAKTYRAAPDDLARLGFAVARALDPAAPDVPDLSSEARTLAEAIAQALREAERPLVIAGPSCGHEGVIQAAANVARALCRGGRPAQLSFTTPECNSLGLALLDAAPLGEAFQAAADDSPLTVVILENDLYRRAPGPQVDAFLDAARQVVVLDHLTTAATAKAALVLPAASFAESDGTFVNHEGRAQRFLQVFVPAGDIQESWRWLRDGMVAAGRREAAAWQVLDDVMGTMSGALPGLTKVAEAAPGASFRLAGQKIARQPHRASGRTAVLANISVTEPKPPEDPDSPLAFSMEGSPNQPPPSLTPYFWAPGWNSIQSANKFQSEVGGPLKGGDAGVRLIEPPQTGATPSPDGAYFDAVPAGFAPRAAELLFVPLYHIFGSEEMSAAAPAIAELSRAPYAALHPADAGRLGLNPGDQITVNLSGSEFRLPLEVRDDLPAGVAGLAVGGAPVLGLSLPGWGEVSRAS